MNYIVMDERDLDIITSLYVRYYNENEEGTWTFEKAYRRIRQVLLTPDSHCLIKEYDDLKSYFLEEIVIFNEY